MGEGYETGAAMAELTEDDDGSLEERRSRP